MKKLAACILVVFVVLGMGMSTQAAPEEVKGKVLNRVAADAEHNFLMDPEKLYVSACYVGGGMTLKRIQPRAKGSADRILKRTSHITVCVAEKA